MTCTEVRKLVDTKSPFDLSRETRMLMKKHVTVDRCKGCRDYITAKGSMSKADPLLASLEEIIAKYGV